MKKHQSTICSCVSSYVRLFIPSSSRLYLWIKRRKVVKPRYNSHIVVIIIAIATPQKGKLILLFVCYVAIYSFYSSKHTTITIQHEEHEEWKKSNKFFLFLYGFAFPFSSYCVLQVNTCFTTKLILIFVIFRVFFSFL